MQGGSIPALARLMDDEMRDRSQCVADEPGACGNSVKVMPNRPFSPVSVRGGLYNRCDLRGRARVGDEVNDNPVEGVGL